MLQELNEKRVTLMEGTALSERDLQRSRAESASAVFLLADRFSPNYQQEDLNVQFQVCFKTKWYPGCCQVGQHLCAFSDKHLQHICWLQLALEEPDASSWKSFPTRAL